ncbi:hypothetical protein TNCV_5011351 [Trichonephila clavipes]|nr:hypothetical protein TNCV_5011351 [Trichonephila clavipes]
MGVWTESQSSIPYLDSCDVGLGESGVLHSALWHGEIQLTDDFVNRNLECVSILLSSIWDSDFHGFGNLGLKRGA